ncbi:MAG: LamG domain-containing protein, partial [Geobacteraceae bacterium]
MRLRICRATVLLSSLILTLFPAGAFAQDQGLVAQWSFEEVATPTARDIASGVEDKVAGFYKYVPGVTGMGLRFDGYTTQVIRTAEQAPQLNGAFSVEAWVALNTLPWNWVPIVDHELYQQVGYSFGIDAWGHVGLQLAINGVWQSLVSTAQLPLKKWAHVVGTFDPTRGLAIYIDGKEVGRLRITGNMKAPEHADLLIGRIREAALPFPAEAIHPIYPVWYSLDGILDEVRIYSRSLSPEDVQKNFADVQAPTGEVLPWPVLPSGTAGAGHFGAYYAT